MKEYYYLLESSLHPLKNGGHTARLLSAEGQNCSAAMRVVAEYYPGTDLIPIANPDDWICSFWKYRFIVHLSEFTQVAVQAEHEQEALATAIDFAEEEGWEGLFLQDEDIDELVKDAVKDGKDEEEYLNEHAIGGNHSRYLSSPHINIVKIFGRAA